MALGKNFRLPGDARPTVYRAHLALDLDGASFEGRLQIDLSLATPSDRITLHAVGLDVSRAELHTPAARFKAARIEPDAESQTVTLHLGAEAPPGTAMLQLAWSGKFSPGLRGLYRAGPLAVTQFEAADARRLFPCFDEPAFKARWEITLLEVPPGAAAISNGALVSDEADASSGRRTVKFATTPVLSSYLVAICAGEMVPSEPELVRDVPLRTWSVPAKRHLTGFAQTVAAAVLPLLEDYFGQPYPYGKLDQVGVPDFEAGAMENAGCITYREVALLLDPDTAPLNVQKRVAEVITHELSHQWFGNLVTMVWWDDLWLNEAFATWMAYKIVDQWRPRWRVWMDFEAGKGAALHLDALKSAHPIRADVHNAEEAGESFDAITYEKGGAVLRMIEGWLGEEKFRDGIRLYMRRHREANATADDLWGALAEASGHPILELANGWIRTTGHPLVTVREEGGTARLAQRRFFSDPGAREEGAKWLVPMVLRFRDDEGVKEQRSLLREAEATVDLGARGRVRWLLGNSRACGFYRTAHEGPALERLLAALREDRAQLRPEERMALVSDQWALVRAGQASVASFLDLVTSLGDEEDHVVLDEIVARLAVIEHRHVSDQDRPRLQRRIADLFRPAAEALGWERAESDGDERRLRRAAVLRAVALVARDALTLAEAQKRFVRQTGPLAQQGLDPNLLDVVVGAAARHADAARFDELLSRAANEVDPASKRRYLHALAMAEEGPVARRGVELAMSDVVQMQDFASFIGVLLQNRGAREDAWRLLRDGWDAVRKKGDSPMILRRIVEALGAFTERRHLEQVEAFLAAHPIEGAKQAIAQTLERLRMDVALRERLVPEVSAWLGREP